MELQKFEHACFTLTKDGQTLVVDPGVLSRDFVVPTTPVAAIVVTHIHPDHLSSEQIITIQAQYPDADVLAHQDVIDALDPAVTNAVAVSVSDVRDEGPFHLEFSGGEHAIIHELAPHCANLSVYINAAVYYPGDSFALPEGPVAVLALPIAAPWMKTADGMEYLMKIRPSLAFPTHDAILSDSGKAFNDNWMKLAADKAGSTYHRLTESLAIDA